MKNCKLCDEDPTYELSDQPISYNERHDAYFCSTCDKWLENPCGDPLCCYCSKRPEKPSDLKKDIS